MNDGIRTLTNTARQLLDGSEGAVIDRAAIADAVESMTAIVSRRTGHVFDQDEIDAVIRALEAVFVVGQGHAISLIDKAERPPDWYVGERRRPGPFIRVAGWLVPGVARVQGDVVPYAEAWARDNRAALDGDGPLWVALGDSLTQGIGAPAHDLGWVGQVRARMAAAGQPYRVVNLGVSGATTSVGR